MWQRLRGCGNQRQSTVNDGQLDCYSYCSSPPLQMCMMKGTGHDTNNPFPGYPFTLAW
jgi:hypothetical protein